ncbi:MAG TPA: STAS domain-containing protein [Sphingomonadales bacterium]|nr:STAS domain-containing protein [Sphingomonadales bacterium]
MTEKVQIEARGGSKPGTRILQMTGHLNLITVPGFLETMRAETARGVILDFTGITMLDSAGVGSLIQMVTAFQKDGRKLILVGLSDRAKNVLELTRVARLFSIYPTAAEAEAQL